MTLPSRNNSHTIIANPALTFTSIDTEMDVINGMPPEQATQDLAVTEKRTLHPKRDESQESKTLSMEGKVYRFDDGHLKFLPSDQRIEPRIHVTVKAKPAEQLIALENLADHRNAIRISQGAGIEPIVVSQFDPIDISNFNLSELDENKPVSALAIPDFAEPQAERVHADLEIAAKVNSDPFQAGSVCSVTTHDQILQFSENSTDSNALVSGDSHLSESVKNRELESRTDLEPIVPAWEVSSFRWPQVITNLCKNHKPAFIRLIESLNLKHKTGPRRIGVLHSHAGQGATTLATCVANILAESGKVLLADLDLENPKLEESANISLQHGWQELVESNQPLSEYLVRETSSGMTLMPLRREAELVARTSKLLNLVKEISPSLTNQFDFSIFDIGNARNLMIAENCHVGFLDAAVVVSDSCGDDSLAVAIYEQLIAAGVPSVVIAENFRNKSRSVA